MKRLQTSFGFIIALGILTNILVSCKKESGPTSVNGRVLEKNSSKPIGDATVFLKKQGMNSGGLYYGGAIMDYALTGSDGKFKFNFEAEKDYTYHLQVYGDNIFDDINSTSDILNKGIKNNIDIKITAKGYLRVCIKNVTKTYKSILLNSSFSGGPAKEFFGPDVDTIVVGEGIGNYTNRFFYYLYKENNTYDYINNNIYFPAFDTTTHYLNY